MEVEILDRTTARGTMTTAMSRDIHAVILAQEQDGPESFCADGAILEDEASVRCVVTREGPFSALSFAEPAEEDVRILALGGGRVRVGFPTGGLEQALAERAGADADPQAEALVAAMFENHALTLTVSGGPIVGGNMVVAPDGLSASFELPLSQFFAAGQEAILPAELYAVVQK